MIEYKQILVVRKDLNMRKGKIAAQCAHASMKVILDLMQVSSTSSAGTSIVIRKLALEDAHPLNQWLSGLFTKVVVSVDSEDELMKIHEEASRIGVLTAVITDAGKTEFNGVPTKTVVAVGPGPAEKIDQITGKLKLL